MTSIAVLPGDGIGPEVTVQAVRVLSFLSDRFELGLVLREGLVGGAAYDATGHPLPPETLELCRSSAGILLGAVGGPKWEKLTPRELRPELGALLPLRRIFNLFANIRPVKLLPALADRSPLRPEITARGIDFVIIRELTGGVYFGEPRGIDAAGGRAFNTMAYTRGEVERVARVAFETARGRKGRVTSVDKANVLEVSMFWREIVEGVAQEYPDVPLDHLYVDNAAMQVILHPERFDTVLTSNLFGDILSDEASVLAGSIGMLPSASLNEGAFGLYEPIHGSAPDIAGRDLANPTASILSAAMLLRHSLGRGDLALLVEEAVAEALTAGPLTADLALPGHPVSGCSAFGEGVLSRLSARLSA
jgi:3-isopropylmalate dehydrogenase